MVTKSMKLFQRAMIYSLVGMFTLTMTGFGQEQPAQPPQNPAPAATPQNSPVPADNPQNSPDNPQNQPTPDQQNPQTPDNPQNPPAPADQPPSAPPADQPAPPQPAAPGWHRFSPPPAQPAPPQGPAPQANPTPAPLPVPAQITIPAGAFITVRLDQFLSSDKNKAGDAFSASLARPVVADGLVVSRRGEVLGGKVIDARKAGRVKGTSQLQITLNSLALADGQQVPVETALTSITGPTSNGRDAAAVVTTTGVGAAIGAAADWGTGAAIGAGAGLVAGLVGVLVTRGRPTVIYPESQLTFKLSKPVTFSTERAPQAFVDARTLNTQSAGMQGPPQGPARGFAPCAGPGCAPYPPPYYYGPYYPYYPYPYYWGPTIGFYYGGFYGRGFYGRGFYRR